MKFTTKTRRKAGRRYGKRFPIVVLIIALMSGALFFEGCAAQRCDCTDISKNYKPPKRIHRLQRH